METRELASRIAAGRTSDGAALSGWSQPTGWVRCQVMGRPAQLWTHPRTDTNTPSRTTSRAEAHTMLRKARNRATALISSSAELYREMALSALRLVRR